MNIKNSLSMLPNKLAKFELAINLFLVLCVAFLFNTAGDMLNNSIFFSSFLLIALMLINSKLTPKGTSKMIDIIACVLSVIFMVQLSIRQYWGALCVNIIQYKIILLLIGIGLFVHLYKLFGYILSMILIEGQGKDLKNSYKLPCMALILAESLLFIGSTYPAIWISGDVAGVYDYSVVTNFWFDWHCIGYVWFVKLCTLIYESHYSVICVQTLAWILVNFYIIDFLGDIRKKAAVAYTGAICLSITPFLYLEAMLKDVVFTIGLLALTAAAYNIIHKEKMNWKDVVCLAVFPTFTVLCRHGGIVPVFATYIALLVLFIIKKKLNIVIKIASIFAFHALAYFMVTVVLFNYFKVVPNPSYVKYGTPMSMIGAAYVAGVEFDDEDIAIMEKAMPLEIWYEGYNKYNVDGISRPFGVAGPYCEHLNDIVKNEGYGTELIKLNAKILIEHPVVYIRALFDMNSMLWEITMPDDVDFLTVCNVPQFGDVTLTPLFTITDYATRHLDHFLITNAFIMRGGMAFFVLIFSLVVLFIKKRLALISMIPIVLVDAMYVISMPNQDPRYILPSIVCAVFMISIMASGAIKCEGASPARK